MLRLLVVLVVLGAAGTASFALRLYVQRAPMPTRFDRKDIEMADGGSILVEFTSPLCYECQVAYPLLQAAAKAHDATLAVIDAKERPDLTAKYSIRTTPTILVVDSRGKVTTGWFTSPSQLELTSALLRAGSR